MDFKIWNISVNECVGRCRILYFTHNTFALFIGINFWILIGNPVRGVSSDLSIIVFRKHRLICLLSFFGNMVYHCYYINQHHKYVIEIITIQVKTTAFNFTNAMRNTRLITSTFPISMERPHNCSWEHT